jgi:acetate---CoA ligase (ADP-forming)
VAVIANLASAVDPAETDTLRAAGVPVLEGTATGLAAMGHLLAYRDFLARRSATLPHRGTRHRRVGVRHARERWRRRLSEAGRPLGELAEAGAPSGGPEPLDEAEGLALLAAWGVPVVAAEVAASLEQALAAAGRVGWPVALKTAAPGVVHKSDVGGVLLGLDGPDRVAAAYKDLAARLGPRVTVAAMAGPGVELALGVVADPQFGPLLMVAAGGVLVEVLGDRRFALPPVDRRQARAMLDRLAARPLLDGVRGGPPADLDAVAQAVVDLSVLAVDLGDRLAALDVNPLVAGPDGCVAADALVVPAARART